MSMNVDDYYYVIQELQTRHNFSEFHAEDAAERLSTVPDIFNAYVSYLRIGTHNNIGYKGYTINDMIQTYGLAPIGGYLMLVEVALNTEKAKEYLERILEEGHEKAEYNPDGSVKTLTHTKVGASDSSPPVCPKCGKPATWIEQYKRWYCYECKEYL
jgi:hypothetical protein